MIGLSCMAVMIFTFKLVGGGDFDYGKGSGS